MKMKKLEEINRLVEEAINLLYFKDTNCWRDILTSFARKCAEINEEDFDYYHRKILYYNSRFRDGQVEEVKQEEVKEQTKTPSSKYYPLFKYFLDEHNVMLLETDCQEIERLLNTQQSNLQPLPDKMPEWFMHTSSKGLRTSIWNQLRYYYGTQPREWWHNLKKGDKVFYRFPTTGYEEVFEWNGDISKHNNGEFHLHNENYAGFPAKYCSPYTDPTQSFRSKLSPEMQVEFDKVVSSLTPNTPQP